MLRRDCHATVIGQVGNLDEAGEGKLVEGTEGRRPRLERVMNYGSPAWWWRVKHRLVDLDQCTLGTDLLWVQKHETEETK